MARWCTVTVTDAKGQRYSLDVRAQSAYDAAHLYATSAKSKGAGMMPSRDPVPTLATVFEIVADGKIFTGEFLKQSPPSNAIVFFNLGLTYRF